MVEWKKSYKPAQHVLKWIHIRIRKEPRRNLLTNKRKQTDIKMAKSISNTKNKEKTLAARSNAKVIGYFESFKAYIFVCHSFRLLLLFLIYS